MHVVRQQFHLRYYLTEKFLTTLRHSVYYHSVVSLTAV
jgi:hypothetical protein